MADTRLKLRQRFGIAAPRMAVRAAMPWYWRWLGLLALLRSSLFAGPRWIYDFGKTLRRLRPERGQTRARSV